MDDKIEQKDIYNEYDYSNVIPDIKVLLWIFEYMEKYNNWLINEEAKDEERNKMLKYEMQDYNYKKSYSQGYEITTRLKNNTIKYNSFSDFKTSCYTKAISNVESVKITLDMTYKCGKASKLEEHINKFEIIFKPYDIKFIRKSNYNETIFNQIEENINKMFKECPTQNTIFCTK